MRHSKDQPSFWDAYIEANPIYRPTVQNAAARIHGHDGATTSGDTLRPKRAPRARYTGPPIGPLTAMIREHRKSMSKAQYRRRRLGLVTVSGVVGEHA